MPLRVSWGTSARGSGQFSSGKGGQHVWLCREQADLAAAGFPEKGTQTHGNLRHPPCGSRPLPCPSSRPGPGAQRRGLGAANAAALLAVSPHTSAPQEAGEGLCRSPPPSPALKANLCSCGALAAGRLSASQMEKARGLSFLPCSLPADALSRARGLLLELCQALGVEGARCCSWAVPRVADGSPQVPSPNLQLLWAQGRIAKSPEAAVPGWLCPVPLQPAHAHSKRSWSWRNEPCVPGVVGDLVSVPLCPSASLSRRRWGAVSPFSRQGGGCSDHVSLLKGSGWLGGLCSSCQPRMPAILQL